MKNNWLNNLIAVVVFLLVWWSMNCCESEIYDPDGEFRGVVSKKYIDPAGRNTPTLDIVGRDGNGKRYRKSFGLLTLRPSSSFGVDLYSIISVGDTLIKKQGSLDLEAVINGEHLTFEYQEWCSCRVLKNE